MIYLPKFENNIFLLLLLLCKFDSGTVINFLRKKIFLSAPFEQNRGIFRYLAKVILHVAGERGGDDH